MTQDFWEAYKGDSPLVAAAIHHGHALRSEVASIMALSDSERLREEDPYTGEWTAVAATRIIVQHSRFEVDLNRPRRQAIYLQPEDAWGLQVWKQQPSKEVVERSLHEYDSFYAGVHALLSHIEQRFGRFVVLDLHTYNHCREGPSGPNADPQQNPEVNLGTGNLNRNRWAPIVNAFLRELRAFDFLGRKLDVRENIKFRGGHFSRWIHDSFPDSGIALAIEFKKFFMDEWSGVKDPLQSQAIYEALESTVSGVLDALSRCSA